MSHPYQLDESISNLRFVGSLFSINPVSKQCKTCTVTAADNGLNSSSDCVSMFLLYMPMAVYAVNMEYLKCSILS